MSKKGWNYLPGELSYNPNDEYDHYSPAFYAAVADSPELIQQAKAANDLFNTYLYGFDVPHPWFLDRQLQDYLNEEAVVRPNLGEGDE